MKMTLYSIAHKAEYVRLCRLYNKAEQNLGDGVAFVALSLRLQIAKAYVPNRWGLPGFIRKQGVQL